MCCCRSVNLSLLLLLLLLLYLSQSAMASKENITSTDILELKHKFTQQQLDEFSALFPGLKTDTLSRFLIARGGDVAKASLLLDNHLRWRSDAANYPVLKSDAMRELAIGKLYVHGVDKEGHPLVVYRSKLNIAAERDATEMMKSAVWWLEHVIRQMPADKSKVTLLIDRSDFESKNSDFEIVKAVGKVFQDNYPERLFRCVVYPSGLVFWGIWNVIKIFLDPVTQAKIQPVLRLEGVQEFISDEYIPRSMGGSCDYLYDINSVDEVDYSVGEIVGEDLESLLSLRGIKPVAAAMSADKI